MANDVFRRKSEHANSGRTAELFNHFRQCAMIRPFSVKKVALTRVAGDDNLRILPKARKEQLKLRVRGVLRLVKNAD